MRSIHRVECRRMGSGSKEIQLWRREAPFIIWMLLAVLLFGGESVVAITESPTLEICSSKSTQKSCVKAVASGCLWFSSPGVCRLAPYCDPGWNETFCTSLANSGACEYVSDQCQYRSTFASTVNAGVDCKMPCNPPGLSYREAYGYNEPCNFCGSEGVCCNSANPVDCVPMGCTTQMCCTTPGGTFGPSKSPSRSPSRQPTLSKSPSRSPSKSPTSISTPTRSPTTSSPSLSPSTSLPTIAPTTSQPSKAPTSRPTSSPTKRPTTGAPTTSPTTSLPTRSPSGAPSFSSPSLSPTTPEPTLSPSTSSPSSSPTPKPTKSPDKYADLNPDDQEAWQTFRAAFNDKKYCYNGPTGSACSACGSDVLRQVVCDWVTPPAPITDGSRRRLQSDPELRIVAIRMRNANLSGILPLSVFTEHLPYLRVLDLSNDPGMDLRIANDLQYPDGGECLPLPECVNGQMICALPNTLPPLCPVGQLGGQTSDAIIPLYGYIAIAIGGLLVFVCCMVLLVFRARRNRRNKNHKDLVPRKSRAPSSPSPTKSATGPAARRSTSGASTGPNKMGERKVSFTNKPLIFREDPNLDGNKKKDKKRRRSSNSRKETKKAAEKRRQSLLKNWRQEYDTATGQPYWRNKKTGEFSWVGPGEEKPDVPFITTGDDDDTIQTFIIGADPANNNSGDSKTKSAAEMIALAESAPDVWEMIYDESTETRYLLNSVTGEFVALPNEDRESRDAGKNSNDETKQEVFVTKGDEEEEDEQDYDPLWKVERDPESGELYWIDVESGDISWTMPSMGTIVSSEMLAATGRYNMGQIFMRKPPNVKRPSVVYAPQPPSSPPPGSGMAMRRSSSGLNLFQPRRSSGLDSLDLGGRRASAQGRETLGSPRNSQNSLRGSRLSMKSSQASMSGGGGRSRRRRGHRDSDSDDSDSDDSDDDDDEEEVTVDVDVSMSGSGMALAPYSGAGRNRSGGAGGFSRGRWMRDDSLDSDSDESD